MAFSFSAFSLLISATFSSTCFPSKEPWTCVTRTVSFYNFGFTLLTFIKPGISSNHTDFSELLARTLTACSYLFFPVWSWGMSNVNSGAYHRSWCWRYAWRIGGIRTYTPINIAGCRLTNSIIHCSTTWGQIKNC